MSAQYGVITSQEASSEELFDFRIMESSSRTANLVDVPSWKINDAWYYDGALDVRDFVTSSGVTTNVEFLSGTLDQWVSDIYTTSIDGVDTLVYKVESSGYYEAENINLDGNNGDLVVNMDAEEIIRASDLASIVQYATFDIDFQYQILWFSYTVHVADLNVDIDYSPPLEGYDFPISVGEDWETDYTQETDYSGSSDYVTIPSDTISQNTTSWEVVSQGYSGTSYSGCSQSYNITNYDNYGKETGYKWYCPAIRGDIRSSEQNPVGFVSEHELTLYQAAGRPKQISVDLEYPLSPLDFDMSAWVNVTSGGHPVANQALEVRYEIGGDVQYVTTAANGSAYLTFDTGHSADDSDGNNELGSHGVIAWIPSENLIGVSTVTIDPEVHEVDLVSRSEGVTVERTRGNRTVTLDSSIGFNAIPGDQLTFSVPVLNRGISNSPATTLVVEAPDGSTSSTSIPRLSSLEEMRVNVDWTVSENHASGDISLTFTADPDEEVVADGNRSNNQGSFAIFIGRLPTAYLTVPSESLTLTEVSFHGLSSYDPDGGAVTCEFVVEKLNGDHWSSFEEDCVHEYTWDDDGTFLISMTITDDESDSDYAEAIITILNRPPEVEIGVDQSSVPVLSPVTFDVHESGDSDTLNPDAPIDIQWHSPCEQGQVGERCTVTPESEGPLTMGVTVMDDDGATTEDTLTIDVSNIAPSNPQAEIWFGPNRLVPQMLGENARYTVNEGDELIFKGWADDSANDLGSLQHHWSPDAELHPEFIISSTGYQSEFGHKYDVSGQHLATLQVVDNDGASTETLMLQFIVINVAPSIVPVTPLLPVAEDELVQLSVEIIDTEGDLPNLIACYDLDPYVNSDSEGNATDDCDLESQHLAHAWSDATTAPDHIVFHVTDDDGESASISISIDVNNVDPDPRASTSDYNPTVGDVIVLSANGTTDSQFDMENMVYIWDLDIGKDSDGDGDPTNDVDREGMWIEVSFSSEGTRTVQMTAFDEGGGSSMALVIEVKKEPFSFGGMMADYGIYIGLLGLIVILVTVLIQRMRPAREEVDLPRGGSGGRSLDRRISMDDAFDDPEYDPFDSDKRERVSSGGADGSEEERGPEESDAPEHTSPEEPSDTVVVSVDEVLDHKDVEALFDD